MIIRFLIYFLYLTLQVKICHPFVHSTKRRSIIFVSSQRPMSRRRDSYEELLVETDDKKKSRLDLIRLSAVVCGIEFCYAAETAFVSPILLQIGLPIVLMSWTWCLPSIIGFFLVPVLGSLSDKCSTRFGKRRPFILLYSLGILFGLILIAKGKSNNDHFQIVDRFLLLLRSSNGTIHRRSCLYNTE